MADEPEGNKPLLPPDEPPTEPERSDSLFKRISRRVSRMSNATDSNVVEMKDFSASKKEQSEMEIVGEFMSDWWIYLTDHQYLPGVKFLLTVYPRHFKDYILRDMIAGLSITVMLIPMVLAYAQLAAVPLENGLYSAFLGLFLYAIFGGSRVGTVGPVALISLLVFTEVSGIGDCVNPNRLVGEENLIGPCVKGLSTSPEVAASLSFWTGVISLFMYFTRLGFLVQFISKPVLDGFVTGAALTIGMSQASNFTGIPGIHGDIFTPFFTELLPQLNKVTFDLLLGVVCVILLKLLEMLTVNRFKDSQSRGMQILFYLGLARNFIMVAIATLLAARVTAISDNVQLVGDFPEGLPAIAFPSITFFPQVVVPAFIVALYANLQHWSIVKPLSSWKDIECEVDGNQEAFAIGVMNVLNGFVGGFPVCGCFTRTIVNVRSGVRSMWSGVLTGFLVLISIQYLTPILKFIPEPALAAIILTAVPSLFRYKEIVALWKSKNWGNMFTFWVTFFISAFVGAIEGIAAGVAASILVVLIRLMTPKVSVKYTKGILVMATRGDISFLSAPMLLGVFEKVLKNPDFISEKSTMRKIIIDLRSVQFLDVDASKAIAESIKLLGMEVVSEDITVCYVITREQVIKQMKLEHPATFHGEFFDSMHDALVNAVGGPVDEDEFMPQKEHRVSTGKPDIFVKVKDAADVDDPQCNVACP